MSIIAEFTLAFPDESKATIRAINAYFRAHDQSHKWPISNRYNLTERAIRQLRKQRQHQEIYEGFEYWLAMDQQLSLIVNKEW